MRSVAIGAVGVIIIIAVGLSIFLMTRAEPADEKLACSHDSDCVPAGCCHSKSTVNRNFAPDCSDMFCTAVCEPDTMDCGQARPKCVVGRCGVGANEPKR